MENSIYIAIDLKSFYASVECVDRRLDPLSFNLVVADTTRTERTICLAVSPPLKAFGIPGRPRLYEVIRQVSQINAMRQLNAPGRRLRGSSCHAPTLLSNPSLALGYIIATPRMARYMDVSAQIYGIYLRYIAPEHIHAYSIDEVFIDATQYLRMYHLTAKELAMKLVREVLAETGITATAGIGPNLYLCKIAMDIVAKHLPADKNGVRIAELDEQSYREKLWQHQPLTDFWRIGHGTARRLEMCGLRTMGDIARMSMKDEDLLYRMFGVNAELLIDHAWGWEPCTMEAIKSYRPQSRSISSGQVLKEPYDATKARLVAREMADGLALDLVDRNLATDQMGLFIGYDAKSPAYGGYVGNDAEASTIDAFGCALPKEARGTCRLGQWTSSSRLIMDAVMNVFDRIADRRLYVRRIVVCAEHVHNETMIQSMSRPEQLELFIDYKALDRQRAVEKAERERERRGQLAMLAIRKRFGKNAIFKGMDLEDGATTRERNMQIGGHRM